MTDLTEIMLCFTLYQNNQAKRLSIIINITKKMFSPFFFLYVYCQRFALCSRNRFPKGQSTERS